MKNPRSFCRILLAFLCATLPLSLFAQGENNNWHFGKKMSINFNTNPPQVQQSNIKTFESSSAISDASGNLLFYTMGSRVWDRNGNDMPNSPGLLGNGPMDPLTGFNLGSSCNGVIIIQNTSNANQYFLFSADAVEDATYKLHYSLIDMTLNGGLGDIVPTVKNVLMMDNVSETLCSTHGINCTSNWLIAISSNLNAHKFYAFKVDENGVSTTPVITTPPLQLGFNNRTCFAPDGVTMVTGGTSFFMSKFNNLTGEVYDFALINTNNSPGPVAFSPDASKVYGAGGTLGLYQYDLSQMPNITAVEVTNIDTMAYTDVRLGPDGKIYVLANTSHYNTFDAVICDITNPNVAGTACNFVPGVFNWPPPWVSSGNGDVYQNLGAPVIINHLVDTVYHPAKDTLLCTGDTLQLHSSDEDATIFTWSTGATTAAIDIIQPGNYWVRSSSHCHITYDSFNVWSAHIRIELGNDTIICIGKHITINAYDKGIDNYQWSNGSNAAMIDVSQPGTYIVTAKNKCGTYNDSVMIDVQDCDCHLFIPNVFSPNEDGINDVFKVNLACNAIDYVMSIYNRFGQRIFRIASPGASWDGTFNGRPVDIGTYFYYIKFKGPLGNIIERKGDITLVR